MMCNYVILKSISDHVEAQMYLMTDSLRVKNFTLCLQILGIICTLVANIWNASFDKTVYRWLEDKGCFSNDAEEEEVHEVKYTESDTANLDLQALGPQMQKDRDKAAPFKDLSHDTDS